MPKVKVTLNIGIYNSEQEDVLDIDQEDWDACETDKDRSELMDAYWQDWANNYIDGFSELVEED
jgi:hypothetical protein